MVNIKLSAFSDEYADSFEEQLIGMKSYGIDFIELRHADKRNVSVLEKDEVAEIKAKLNHYGISVSAIGSPLGKRDVCDFAEFKPDLEQILMLAEIFESDLVRIFSFYHWEGKEEQILSCLSEAVAFAKSRGVKLYHENELGIYGDRPEDCKRIVEATGCGCIFDSANFVLSGHKIEEAEALLLPLSDFYHVKDGNYTGEIVPAGYGDGNLRALLSRDNVTLTIEPHLYEFGGLANLVDHGLKQSQFVYRTPREAFDAGVAAVKSILDENHITY